MADTTLITLDFRGATLVALERPDGIFVAINPICDAIGVDSRNQRERIERDEVLNDGADVMPMPTSGGVQESFCLRVDLVNGWLLGIDASRVRPEAKEPLLAYKRECHAVLFEHFYQRVRGGPRVEPSYGERLRTFEVVRGRFGEEAAWEMWRHLGLPVTPTMRARQGTLFPSAEGTGS